MVQHILHASQNTSQCFLASRHDLIIKKSMSELYRKNETKNYIVRKMGGKARYLISRQQKTVFTRITEFHTVRINNIANTIGVVSAAA